VQLEKKVLDKLGRDELAGKFLGKAAYHNHYRLTRALVRDLSGYYLTLPSSLRKVLEEFLHG
jgi:hypothetical protein